ncbi:MAG: hypothetical protein D6816_07030 [Bacteroidetes bacterium]|nr:MAG: hypothetical protein D6816_07030 [Bacteroidota bacterium]
MSHIYCFVNSGLVVLIDAAVIEAVKSNKKRCCVIDEKFSEIREEIFADYWTSCGERVLLSRCFLRFAYLNE